VSDLCSRFVAVDHNIDRLHNPSGELGVPGVSRRRE